MRNRLASAVVLLAALAGTAAAQQGDTTHARHHARTHARSHTQTATTADTTRHVAAKHTKRATSGRRTHRTANAKAATPATPATPAKPATKP